MLTLCNRLSQFVHIVVETSTNCIAQASGFIDMNKCRRMYGSSFIAYTHRVQSLIINCRIVDYQDVFVWIILVNLRIKNMFLTRKKKIEEIINHLPGLLSC